MGIRIVRLGTARAPGEGLRIGTVRRPPRGVPKAEFGKRDFYDQWLPELAPSAELVSWALVDDWTPARWRRFERRYRSEMRETPARHLIEVLSALSHQTNFAAGCYCEDATRCHRSVLRELFIEAGADVVDGPP